MYLRLSSLVGSNGILYIPDWDRLKLEQDFIVLLAHINLWKNVLFDDFFYVSPSDVLNTVCKNVVRKNGGWYLKPIFDPGKFVQKV